MTFQDVFIIVNFFFTILYLICIFRIRKRSERSVASSLRKVLLSVLMVAGLSGRHMGLPLPATIPLLSGLFFMVFWYKNCVDIWLEISALWQCKIDSIVVVWQISLSGLSSLSCFCSSLQTQGILNFAIRTDSETVRDDGAIYRSLLILILHLCLLIFTVNESHFENDVH